MKREYKYNLTIKYHLRVVISKKNQQICGKIWYYVQIFFFTASSFYYTANGDYSTVRALNTTTT